MGLRTSKLRDPMLDEEQDIVPEPDMVSEDQIEMPEISIEGTLPNKEPRMEETASALVTPAPKTPAVPSSEPGKTAAVQAAKQETDEYEPLFKEYETARKQYATDTGALEKETEDIEKSQQVTTGIAGALQSFGEGLAAITGGSAKPVQTGAATLREISGQRVAAQERKAKTLKERLQMAREPLEAKATEIKFRDVFEQRQKEKRLNDPASDESRQAQQSGQMFIDTLTANLRNMSASPEVIGQVEGVKDRLQGLSANQIDKFMKILKEQKFGTAFEAKTQAQMSALEAKLAGQESLMEAKLSAKLSESEQKRDQKLKDNADTEYQKDRIKVNEQIRDLRAKKAEMQNFSQQLDKALAGDKSAQEYVARNVSVIDYIQARLSEPKGVFTDQDKRELSKLGVNVSWFDQFRNWFSKGMTGRIEDKEYLQKLKGVLDTLQPTFNNPEGNILKSYSDVYSQSSNPYMQEKAGLFSETVSKEPEPAQSVSPVDMSAEKFENISKLNEAIKAGKKFKVGDILEIGNIRYKIGPNGKPQKM